MNHIHTVEKIQIYTCTYWYYSTWKNCLCSCFPR